MNYIDRYVYAVTRQLPEAMRADVEKELRANIEDMLPDNATEDDLLKVLTSLGEPSTLANQYRSHPRYLISPAVFNDYLTTLKLVTCILVAVAIIAGFFSNLTEYEAGMPSLNFFVNIVTDILTGIFTGICTAFMWVTLTFAIIDYFHVKYKKGDSWSPKDLPLIPITPAAKIPRSDSIAEIIFSTLFAVIFLRYPQLLGWYDSGNALESSTPLFNEAVLSRFSPFIILLTIVTVTIAIIKLVYGQWNFLLAGLNSARSILSAVFALTFLNYPGIFNEDFLARMAHALKIDLLSFTTYWYRGIHITLVVIIIISVAEILMAFYKAYKNSKRIGL